jgi:hypothetical protein
VNARVLAPVGRGPAPRRGGLAGAAYAIAASKGVAICARQQ